MLKSIYPYFFVIILMSTSRLLPAQNLRAITEFIPELSYACGEDLCGMNVDVVKEIIKRLGLNTKIELLPWKRGYHELLTKPNTILFATTYTKERSKKFQWCGPITSSKYIFVKKAGSNLAITSMDDAKNLKIGTYANDVRESILLKAGFDKSNFSHLHGTEADQNNLKMLLLGRTELWFTEYSAAMGTFDQLKKTCTSDNSDFCKQFGKGTVKNAIEVAYNTNTYYQYIAISKETSPKFVRNCQATIDQMKADGSYKKIMTRYKSGKYFMTFDKPLAGKSK